MSSPPPQSVETRTTRGVRDDDPFEYAGLDGLLYRALRDVSERKLTDRERAAAARLAAFLITEQPLTEAVTTDVLTALWKAIALSKVVRTLLIGLRHALGDHERIVEWTQAVADRALHEGHLPSLITALRILVELRDYDGKVPARWRVSILLAIEKPELAAPVRLFTQAYMRRFPTESWRWVREADLRSTVALRRGSR